MTQKYGTDKVFSPGTVIISAAGEVSDIRKIVSSILAERSEERRVGKECRSRWSPYH